MIPWHHNNDSTNSTPFNRDNLDNVRITSRLSRQLNFAIKLLPASCQLANGTGVKLSNICLEQLFLGFRGPLTLIHSILLSPVSSNKLCFLIYLIFLSVVCCLFTHLSSRFRYLTPCPCVCSVLIIVTCPSSPCVYSLCVPVVSLPVRLSFLRVVSVPAISHVNTFPRDTDPCLPYRLCF